VVREKEVVGSQCGWQTAGQGTGVGPGSRGGAQNGPPDGKHIAFVSEREGHSFIAIYDFDGESIRYMAPSVDKDSMPRWSPDGKWIVFVRVAGTEQKLPLIPVRPKPWSLWIADAATGSGRLLWSSGEKPEDSLPELSEDGSLNVAADGRLIFSSEQDGRNHLYSIAASGGTAAQLTPGDFDVEDVTLSADKTSIIYSSNQDDVDRRHFWTVGISGSSPPQALTTGETMEWSPVQTGDGRSILCLGSTATSPAMPYQVSAQGREMIARQALPSDFPSAALVTPKQVIFKSDDGLTLHGQLFSASQRQWQDSRISVHAWRADPADDAGLPLHGLLPQCIRRESVPRQPWICRVVRELPPRSYVRASLSRSPQ